MTIIISFGSSTKSVELPFDFIKTKSFGASTDYLIASSVQDKYYRKAVSLGVPILDDTIYTAPYKSEHEFRTNVESYYLPKFKGLTVCFYGPYRGADVYDVKANGGDIVATPAEATHVIVAHNCTGPSENKLQSTNPYIVTTSWIRESTDLGWCANEKFFALPNLKKLRRKSARMQIVRKFSFTKNNDDSGSAKFKRYQLCRELFLSEVNCLKALDFMIRREQNWEYRMFQLSEDNNQLTPTQNEIIFGVFPLIKEVHNNIVERLGKVLEKWDDHTVVGNIFIDLAQVMKAAYLPYFQGIEMAIETFKECKNRNSRFRQYIEMKEKDRSLDKQKIDYLLNVPNQQLTSRISVTVKELIKKAEKSNPDYVYLRSADDAIAAILSQCNEQKKISSTSEQLYRQIKDVPVRILYSSRQFIARSEFLLIARGATLRAPQLVEIVLFHDLLMITRHLPHNSTSCMTGISSSGTERKKSEFVEAFRMPCIRQIKIRRKEEQSYLELTLRNDSGGDMAWKFEMINEIQNMERFACLIIEKIREDCGRLLHLESSIDYPTLPRGQSLDRSTSVMGMIRSFSHRLKLRSTKSDLDRRALTLPNARGPESSRLRRAQTPQLVRNSVAEAPTTESHGTVDPYEGIHYFSPHHKIQFNRIKSQLDECC